MLRSELRDASVLPEKASELEGKLPKWEKLKLPEAKSLDAVPPGESYFVRQDKTGSLPTGPMTAAPAMPPAPANPMPVAPVIPAPPAPKANPSLTGKLQIPDRTTAEVESIKDVAATLFRIPTRNTVFDSNGTGQEKKAVDIGNRSAETIRTMATALAARQLAKFGGDREVLVEQIKLLEVGQGYSDMPRTLDAQQKYYLDLMTRHMQKQLGQDLETQFTQAHDGQGLQKFLAGRVFQTKASTEIFYQVCGVNTQATAALLRDLLAVPENYAAMSIDEKKPYFQNQFRAMYVYQAVRKYGSLGEVDREVIKLTGSDVCSKVLDTGRAKEFFSVRFGPLGEKAAEFYSLVRYDHTNPRDIADHVKRSKELGNQYLTGERAIYDAYFKAATGKSYTDMLRHRLTDTRLSESLERVQSAQRDQNAGLARTFSTYPEIDVKNCNDGVRMLRDLVKAHHGNDAALFTAIELAADKEWQIRELMPYVAHRMKSAAELSATLDALDKALVGFGDTVQQTKKELAAMPDADPIAPDVNRKLNRAYNAFAEKLDKTLSKAAGLIP